MLLRVHKRMLQVNVYVLPQILFGLEVMQNPESEIRKLEKCKGEVMKQVQHL